MHDVTYNLILFIASFLIWFMALGIVILWLSYKKKKKGILLSVSVAVIIAVFTSQIIKTLFPYPRPYEIYDLPPLTFGAPKDASFPSTHTAIAFALAFSLHSYYPKYAVLFFVCATLVGIGRITSNVHFLGDVAGGVLVGYFANKVGKLILKNKSLDN
ncbi:MAG: phosphatase PAP2 family protein [Patescibacteria group bacterium]|nr:phosphatase PAP2 family protein [Patescibacteria group bacterium]